MGHKPDSTTETWRAYVLGLQLQVVDSFHVLDWIYMSLVQGLLASYQPSPAYLESCTVEAS